jgi:hypothetical protein
VKAYITFERQDGYETAAKITGSFNICGKLKSKHGFKLLNQPIYFNKSTEPSNIIWENLGVPFGT